MTIISTSTAANATAYSNQRKVDRTSNGVLWAFYSTGNAVASRYSTDEGASWVDSVATFGTGNTYQHSPSLFIDLDDYAHVVYKDGTNGNIIYRRGTPNAGRTSWSWSSAFVVNGSSDRDFPDVVAHREGTGWAAHVVFSRPLAATYHQQVDIDSGGSVVVQPQTTIGGSYGNGQHTYPSIDFNHTGDGKTVAGGTPHLYVAWSAGSAGAGLGIRFRKAVYSGGTWTWNTEREIDSTLYRVNDNFSVGCLFDGTRVIIGGTGYDGTSTFAYLYDRDAADTATTQRVLTSIAPGPNALYATSITYDNLGNVYFYGQASGSFSQGKSRKFTRSTATFDSTSSTYKSTTTVGWNTTSLMRGYSDNRIDFVYTDGTESPYNVTHDSIVTGPSTPSIIRAGRYNIPQDTGQPLSFYLSEYSHPEDTAIQQVVLSRTLDGTVEYWDDANQLWSSTVVSAGSTTDPITVAAGWASPGQSPEFSVQYYDTNGGASVTSAPVVVQAAAPEQVVTTPVNIASSSGSTATAYSNQRKIDRTQNGVLWSCYWTGSDRFRTRSSTDNGATWSSGGDIVMSGGITNYTPNISFFIDVDDYAHVVYKDQQDGYIYYRRGTPNAGRTSWTWSAATSVSTVASGRDDYPDIVAHREGTGWKAHVVISNTNGSSTGFCVYYEISISSGGAITVGTRTGLGSYSNGIHVYPSIDFNHTGDGKTVAGDPDIYVAWSTGATGAGQGIRFKKGVYAGGIWGWNPEREIDSTRYLNNGTQNWINCLFDGTRVIIGGNVFDGASIDVVLHDRDAADTTTTLRTLVENSSSGEALVQYGSLTYTSSGDVYFVSLAYPGGVGPAVGHRKWNRNTGVFDAQVLLASATKSQPFVSAKRGYSNGRIEFVYTDGAASPYNVTYGSIEETLVKPTILLPETGVVQDGTESLVIQANDYIPTNTETHNSTVLRRVANGTTTYWNDFSQSWSGIEVTNGSANHFVLPAGWNDGSNMAEFSIKYGTSAGAANTDWSDPVTVYQSGSHDSTVVSTSTASTATAYSNQRKIDRCQNGVLWSVHYSGDNSLQTPYQLWYSTDDGATWTDGGTIISNGLSNTYTGNISLFIDVDDYAHVVYKDPHNGYIYYRRGTPNTARTAWTWSAAVAVWASTVGDLPDVVAHREGAGWSVHVVTSRQTTSTTSVIHWGMTIASDGTLGTFASTVLDSGYNNTNHTYPSIDFNHTGDGKTVYETLFEDGFEDGTLNKWTLNSSPSISTSNVRTGTYSAVLNNFDEITHWIDVTNYVGQEMTFRYWADVQGTDVGGSALNAQLFSYDGPTTSANIVETSMFVSTRPTEFAGWQEIVGSFTIPAGATHLRINLNTADDATAYIDDVNLSLGAPHLYVAWSAGATGAGLGIRFRKATYGAASENGPVWTWGTEREIDSTRYIDNDFRWLNCLFDGTRIVIVGLLNDNGNEDLILYDRDVADTTTTLYVLYDNMNTIDQIVRRGTASYDSFGNLYLFGIKTAVSGLYHYKWTRATSSLSTHTTITGAGPGYFSAKRSYSNGRIEFVYTDGTASPYNVTYGSILTNQSPAAPTIVEPTAGQTYSGANPLLVDWVFNDPDSIDTQSSYGIRREASGSIMSWDSLAQEWFDAYLFLNPDTQTQETLPAGWSAGANNDISVTTQDNNRSVSPDSTVTASTAIPADAAIFATSFVDVSGTVTKSIATDATSTAASTATITLVKNATADADSSITMTATGVVVKFGIAAPISAASVSITDPEVEGQMSAVLPTVATATAVSSVLRVAIAQPVSTTTLDTPTAEVIKLAIADMSTDSTVTAVPLMTAVAVSTITSTFTVTPGLLDVEGLAVANAVSEFTTVAVGTAIAYATALITSQSTASADVQRVAPAAADAQSIATVTAPLILEQSLQANHATTSSVSASTTVVKFLTLSASTDFIATAAEPDVRSTMFAIAESDFTLDGSLVSIGFVDADMQSDFELLIQAQPNTANVDIAAYFNYKVNKVRRAIQFIRLM